jgi:aldehyde dehydrogenase (NAD+)
VERGSGGARPALAACEAARRAGADWAAWPPGARARVLARAARELAGAASLVERIARDTGRDAHEVWSAELLPAVDALRWLAGPGRRALRPRRLRASWLQWYVRPARHELRWEPFGVVGVVSPGNSVLFLATAQVAAALLGGNAVVWKPAPAGLSTARALLDLFRLAGLPPGALQLVAGEAEAARGIVRAGVDKLFFTGGEEGGLALYRLQAARGRPAALELSGRHAAIVLGDAPVAETAQGLLWGKLANAGRNCVAVQLALVERPLAAPLTEALAAQAAAAPAGSRSLPEGERRRLLALVDDALARGARLAHAGPEGGFPAVLAGVTPGMRVADEEVGGPILAVAAVDGVEEAIRRVNASPCRLSASVWTADVARARRLAARLDVGQVWINDALHPTAQPAVPLTGRGRSGFGASRGLAGLMETVQPKVVSVMPGWAPRFHHRSPTPAAARLLAASAALAGATGIGGRLRAGLALLWAIGAAGGKR